MLEAINLKFAGRNKEKRLPGDAQVKLVASLPAIIKRGNHVYKSVNQDHPQSSAGDLSDLRMYRKVSGPGSADHRVRHLHAMLLFPGESSASAGSSDLQVVLESDNPGAGVLARGPNLVRYGRDRVDPDQIRRIGS